MNSNTLTDKKITFITSKVASCLENYISLAQLQEKNWSESEKSVAKEHLNTLNLYLASLMSFQEDFKKTGDFNLHIHFNKNLLNFFYETKELHSNEDLKKYIEDFKIALLTMETSQEDTENMLETMETTADTILKFLK